MWKARQQLSLRVIGAVFILCMMAGLFMLSAVPRVHADENPNRLVYVVPLHDTVDSGMAQFLERSYLEAEEVGARYIVLDIRTFGGDLNAAIDIGTRIQEYKIPTIAFVHGNALSAGSYIALSADQIVMQNGSVIGSAAIVDAMGNRVTDSKLVSTWISYMHAAAEQSGRNPLYAEGMVDDQVIIDVPEIGKTFGKGQLIAFSYSEALAAGYAEHVAEDLDGVLDYLGVSGYTIVEMEMSLAEHAGRFLTHPAVQIILLIIGIAGLVIELLVPGFGVPGFLGITGFTLYFFGNYVSGFAGVEHIFLFVAGIILMLLELFVPSFGILGVLGIIALFSGVVLSANQTGQAFLSLGIATLVAIIVIVIFIRIFKKRGVWNRFILRDKLDTEGGFISQTDRQELIGATGITSTVLRPSGTALIDGKRIDVVADGAFIQAGTPIKVVHVEGMRVVVSEWKEEES